MRKVVVIGAGAAGMMAAISAAEHGAHTVVLEHKDRVGKKILSTGNGRCNFTNLVQTPQCYRSDDPKFPWRVITQFDEKKTVEFFQIIGVYAKNRNGYLYPNSDQAGAVLDPFAWRWSGFVWKCTQRQKFWKSFRKRTGLSSEPEMGM